MKHNIKITAILLLMFIVTQFIGIYVVNHYTSGQEELPYGMETPVVEQESEFVTSLLPSIIIAFIIAISIMFLLMKFRSEIILKVWFFIVVTIALGITINAFAPNYKYASLIILAIALPLAFMKIFRRNFVVHNLTELLVYPGIAAVFVPILNILTMVILLLLISGYDMWAVWHSGIMQKMARYQMNKLQIFAGFFIPYASKRVKEKIKNMKKSDLKKGKIKINLAILGGGDVIFPIITAGVVMARLGLGPALMVTLGATLGLGYLFFAAEKKKFYPAMPFITIGILVMLIISYLIF